jgi:hypothetical protein
MQYSAARGRPEEYCAGRMVEGDPCGAAPSAFFCLTFALGAASGAVTESFRPSKVLGLILLLDAFVLCRRA